MINDTSLDFTLRRAAAAIAVLIQFTRKQRRVAAVAFWLAVDMGIATSFGQTPATPSASLPSGQVTAQLGSLDFKPAPDRPVGWRGDWTGRFPAATPPTEWTRRVNGITSQIKYQAGKPTGEPGKDSFRLEYFTLKEWLVAGPFSADDPAKNMAVDFLGGEDKVQPNEGDKAGDVAWKHLRAGIDTQSRHYHNDGTCGDLNVDFVYAFGNLPESGAARDVEVPLNNKVAYAHTWLHAPARANVLLRVNFSAAAVKVLLNGQAVEVKQGQPVAVTLQEGWNRLLLKAVSSEAVAPAGQNAWISRWRLAAYLEPVPPISYESRNITWMTKMTGRSMSQPIVVADRIYVGSGITDLLCIDKKTGKILWLRSNTPYDALTEEQRARPEIKEHIEPLAAGLKALNDEAAKVINAAGSPDAPLTGQPTNVDRILKSKADAERALHNAFKALDRKKYPPMFENEVSASNVTPLSDGHFVYWACGGGMKGPGAHVVSCFDFDGKRIWSRHDSSLGSQEHGNHMSPNLVDGKLILRANMTLLAYDAMTGQELWRNSPDDWQNGGHGSTQPLVVKLGDILICHSPPSTGVPRRQCSWANTC